MIKETQIGIYKPDYSIYIDKETGCQYIRFKTYHSSMALRVNSNGKPICNPEDK